jgi:hypothetical protein
VYKSSKDVHFAWNNTSHKRISPKHFFPAGVARCVAMLRTQAASIYTIYQINECKNEMLAAAGERARQRGNEVHESTSRVYIFSIHRPNWGASRISASAGHLRRATPRCHSAHIYPFCENQYDTEEVLGVMSPKCTLARREMAHLRPQTLSFRRGPISLLGNRPGEWKKK